MAIPARPHLHLRVFLASPGDVADERTAARLLMESGLAHDPLLSCSVSFYVVAWDHPAADTPMPAHLKEWVICHASHPIATRWTGVSSMAGSKGAGDFKPTASDLITSGGVVAPERLQHLLWTIVGGLAFFFYTLAISPAEIQNLPEIPNGFLYLMGISAGGYLGGKIVRGPGPKITAVHGTVVAGAGGAANGIALTVDGSNLALSGASYFLARWIDTGFEADIQIQPTNLPAQADATYATRLSLNVSATPQLTIAAGTKYRFTIINPDGEKAVWEFTTAA